MKRFFAALLACVMLLLMSSCKLLTTEEVLTIYNASSECYIDCVAIATTPDVLGNEDAIILFTPYEKMNSSSAEGYRFKVEDSMLDDTWYIYVSGSLKEYANQYGLTEMFKVEQEVGELFAGQVHGFQIDFDAENYTFILTPLSGI